MATTPPDDAIAQDARKLSLKKKKKTRDDEGYSGGVDENTMRDEGPCLLCSAEHPSCDVCYKFHHSQLCPYFYQVPKGARFDPGYELVCACCNAMFNEDRWICTMCCGTTAVVMAKGCNICYGTLHSTYECPVDKAQAAIAKSHREKISHLPKIIPYLGFA